MPNFFGGASYIDRLMEQSGQFAGIKWARNALLPGRTFGQGMESRSHVGFNSCGVMTFFAAHDLLWGLVRGICMGIGLAVQYGLWSMEHMPPPPAMLSFFYFKPTLMTHDCSQLR